VGRPRRRKLVDDREIPRGVATLGSVVEVHFDGACEPPKGGGVATFGYRIEGAGFLHEDFGLAVRPFSDHATNNVAEYVAAIRALEWLADQRYPGDVVLLGDSQLVIRQMLGEYRVRAEHLRAYHEHLGQLARKFRRVEFRWIPREENARADALSKRALVEAGVEPRQHRPGEVIVVVSEDEPREGPSA
jgi:ribonuclease HI